MPKEPGHLQGALPLLKNRHGQVLLGPSRISRIKPFVLYGAPLLAVLGMFLTLPLLTAWPWWLALPAAWILAYLGLALLGALVLSLSHQAWYWDQQQEVLRRHQIFPKWGSRVFALSQLQAVEENFSPNQAAVLVFTDERVQLPFAAWDDFSFNALRQLCWVVEGRVVDSRQELLHQDALARLKYENPQLAAQYGMPWKAEFEDPNVFLEAFDQHRQAMAKKRK